ncbi:glutathione S-transferase T3-like [Rutidosis leptorrhynchoides]|uniref:glutathione S-transferase T3-like n=1 Tax=Rutidosis leptorrhynchoides TaxID=125765 RepID=UPI003A99C1DC
MQETQTDIEEVEETQETAASKKGKRAKVMWSDEESRILAECWMRATLNPNIGNSQTHSSFWGTVRQDYNSKVREQRRMDQISGKWTKMAKDIKLFVALYEKLVKHWPSGANDNDIMMSVKKAFREQQKKAFAYEDARRVVRDCPQFQV